MVSWEPDSAIAMFRAFAKRTSDGAYQLFFLACEPDDGRLPLASDTDPPPFLCVFSPVTGTNRTCAWEMRRTLRWNVPVSVFERFRMDATFSFQGKGFWADLSQVLIYCDLHTASDDSAVDFGCIDLPGECQLNLKEMSDCPLPMKKVTRTIACVGDSICFVCIHRGKHHADDSVTMWTLELPGGQWKNEARFPVRELWRPARRLQGGGVAGGEGGVPSPHGGWCPLPCGDWPVLGILLFRCFFGGSHLHL